MWNIPLNNAAVQSQALQNMAIKNNDCHYFNVPVAMAHVFLIKPVKQVFRPKLTAHFFKIPNYCE